MANTIAIRALRSKRAHLAGQVTQARRVLAKLQRELDTVDATINIFEPATNPELIPPVRPYVRGIYFQYGEMTRLCYAALREAGGPVTTRHVADYAIAAKGFDADRRVRECIVRQCYAAFTRLSSRGRVRKIMKWPDVWWELA